MTFGTDAFRSFDMPSVATVGTEDPEAYTLMQAKFLELQKALISENLGPEMVEGDSILYLPLLAAFDMPSANAYLTRRLKQLHQCTVCDHIL